MRSDTHLTRRQRHVRREANVCALDHVDCICEILGALILDETTEQIRHPQVVGDAHGQLLICDRVGETLAEAARLLL